MRFISNSTFRLCCCRSSSFWFCTYGLFLMFVVGGWRWWWLLFIDVISRLYAQSQAFLYRKALTIMKTIINRFGDGACWCVRYHGMCLYVQVITKAKYGQFYSSVERLWGHLLTHTYIRGTYIIQYECVSNVYAVLFYGKEHLEKAEATQYPAPTQYSLSYKWLQSDSFFFVLNFVVCSVWP